MPANIQQITRQQILNAFDVTEDDIAALETQTGWNAAREAVDRETEAFIANLQAYAANLGHSLKEQMTTYRDRHLSGEYFGTVTTTVEEPEDLSDEIAADVAEADSYRELDVHPLDNLMRKELVTIADQHGIPNYGTRAQLLQRLKDRGVTS